MLTIRTFALGVALAALSASILPTAGHAYTPEQQQACSPDAFRLCGSEIPDVDRVTACMIARKSQLSPECRRFFRADPEPVAVEAPLSPAGRPVSIRPKTAKRVSAKPVAARPVAAKPVAAKKPTTPKPRKPAKPSTT